MEKETICVDANVLISALIGGASREVLFSNGYRFITTDFTIKEVMKYIPRISKKSGVSADKIAFALHLLPLTVFGKDDYKNKLALAKKLIGHIDPKDVDILALALTTNGKLWSHDKHFEGVPHIILLSTGDFPSPLN